MTGGREENKSIALDSTEILTEGGDNWKLTGSLPMALVYIRGVSLQDRILMIGKGSFQKKSRENNENGILGRGVSDLIHFFKTLH